MELSRFLRPSILKFDDWFINVSIGGAGGEDSNIQKDVYFSGKNAYLYASTGSGVTELHIFGNSVQDGTPSIENPVPIISVGENYLQLYSLDINDPSKSGQIIDFGNIKLRSLPNGVCDEIVYQNGQWKHIQRIVSIIIDKNTTIQDQLAASNRVTIQVNYTLITKASANNTNLCSKISNSASSVPRFHNYPNTIYVVWNSNKPATFKEAKSLIMGAEFCCELAEPIETILDSPKLQTLNGTTYLLTNDQQVKPYLQGYYDVDLKVSGKKLEYAQDGLIGWWQPFGLTNADKPTVIPDKLGNSDLTIKNIGYTNESGFHPTYLQFDGIDDYATAGSYTEPIISAHATVSNLIVNNINISSHWVSIFDSKEKTGISISNNKAYRPASLMEADCKYYKDGELTTDFTNIINNDNIVTLGLQYSGSDAIFNYLNISNFLNNSSYYKGPERFYEAIAYNRVLTDEEVQNNFLVSQIRNGINIPNDIDPIDIISTLTYGSGKAFPVYNTYIDRNNNNVESLIICGYTEQDGTPTPENPIELKSVGDQSLVLCIYNEDKSKVQYIDFGDITLRSLPDGISDTIEWDGTQWKYIQRIEHIHIDGSINITKIVNNTNLNISYVNIPVSIVNGQNVKPYSSMYCNRKLYRKNGYNIANSIFTVDANTYFYITYLNDTGEPYTSDDIKAINDEYPLDIYYAINEPIETILEDLPAPQTYDQVTYFSTPNTEVRPYIMATVKAIKPLEYQGNISAWWYFGGNKSNETDRQITDISGNGNDLTPYNFAWNRESGWDQGGIRSDGIDDNIYNNIDIILKSGLLVSSNFEYTSNGKVKCVFEGFQAGDNVNYYPGIIYNDSANFKLSVSGNIIPINPNGKDYLISKFEFNSNYNLSNIRIFSNSNKKQVSEGTIHELVLFENSLTDNQYDNNLNVAKQRNGIEDHVNFTAIASGKKFPIYYTIEGDTIKELHIYGESMQEGTPTHDTPQEIYSSGDEGLKLCVTDSETGNALQVIDFGNIVLRSLPSGIRDEIVYKDGTWTYIQRVSAIVFSEFSNTEIAIRYENTETKEIIQVSIVNSAISHYCKNGTLCYCNSASPVLLLNPTDNNTVSYTINTGTSTGWRFGIQGITVDDIDAYVQDYKVQCEIETPIETTLDLPDITTYADITYIGTPNAKVKPYIECVAETYKSLEFVKDGLVELYDFAPSKWQDNKIYNEIDNSQYITANNFNNTVESGAFSNYTQFDGIDDYFDNNGSVIAFVQIYAKDFVFNPDRNSWIFAGSATTTSYNGLKIGIPDGNIMSEVGKISMDDKEQVDYIPQSEWSIGIHSYQLFYLNRPFALSRIGQFINGGYYTKFKLYNLLAYSTELTTEQIANNLNCFKQLKGIDGDIDISNESQLLDLQGNELTDSQGYYLTVAL